MTQRIIIGCGKFPAGRQWVFSLAACLLAGCSTPSINLSTNEPIKVDITMRVDVHQYQETGSPQVANGSPTPQASATGATLEERRRNRQADIQVFKNSRLIGEAKDGQLKILTNTDGDYGDYVRRTVEQENSDRMEEMKQLAEKEKRPLADVQLQQAALWINRSFKGEWIENKKPDGTYGWIQKAG
jgi:uncharacterized protein YdbL (DUF1318 family)